MDQSVDSLVLSFDGFKGSVELLLPIAAKGPTGFLLEAIGLGCEAQVFSIRIAIAIELGTHNADQVAVLVVHRAATIARADGGGNLYFIIAESRDNARAEGISQALGMANDKNLRAIAADGERLHKVGGP